MWMTSTVYCNIAHIAMEDGFTFTGLARLPKCESSQSLSTVDPRFHLYGSMLLLLFIYYLLQYPLTSRENDIAVFSLSCNVLCFLVSAVCHQAFNSRNDKTGLYFRLDYAGIVLYIWATSLSVLLLEIDDYDVGSTGSCGLTLAGLIAAASLLLLPLDKTSRIAFISGFGALAFLGVMLLIACYSCFSLLSASYSMMVTINCIGGWHYIRESGRYVQGRVTESPLYEGHLSMHICSVCASVIYGLFLVYFVTESE